MTEKLKVFICYLTYKYFADSFFFKEVYEMSQRHPDIELVFMPYSKNKVDVAMAAAWHDFIKSDCDWFWLCANDVRVPPNSFDILKKHRDKHIIFGWCTSGYSPFVPIIFRFHEENGELKARYPHPGYPWLEEVPTKGVVENDLIGPAVGDFIHRDIEKLICERPLWEYQWDRNTGSPIHGEDIHFDKLVYKNKDKIRWVLDYEYIVDHFPYVYFPSGFRNAWKFYIEIQNLFEEETRIRVVSEATKKLYGIDILAIHQVAMPQISHDVEVQQERLVMQEKDSST